MSSDNIAIRVRNLGKKYQLGGPQERYLTLRDAIVNSVKAPFVRFHHATPAEEFWALKDVSFDVEPGEVVGIIWIAGAESLEAAIRFCFGPIIHVISQSFLIIKVHSVI